MTEIIAETGFSTGNSIEVPTQHAPSNRDTEVLLTATQTDIAGNISGDSEISPFSYKYKTHENWPSKSSAIPIK